MKNKERKRKKEGKKDKKKDKRKKKEKKADEKILRVSSPRFPECIEMIYDLKQALNRASEPGTEMKM
jgi:hypothetical protein